MHANRSNYEPCCDDPGWMRRHIASLPCWVADVLWSSDDALFFAALVPPGRGGRRPTAAVPDVLVSVVRVSAGDGKDRRDSM